MRERHPKMNGYSNAGRLAALAERTAKAEERMAARLARSDEDQIHLLNQRPGCAVRERAKIARRLGMLVREKETA
jgi:hypothetical protein